MNRRDEIKGIIADINVGNLRDGDIALSDIAGEKIINEAVTDILDSEEERMKPIRECLELIDRKKKDKTLPHDAHRFMLETACRQAIKKAVSP